MTSQINIASFTCSLSALTVFTSEVNTISPNMILRHDEPFSVAVRVDLAGAGAIALVPLGMSIQVEFFAHPLGIGDAVELGEASINTVAHVFTYTPKLAVASAVKVGLVPEKIYQIKALLRVGAAGFPALIVGLTEGLMLQIYHQNPS
jgi:hypothetical protein